MLVEQVCIASSRCFSGTTDVPHTIWLLICNTHHEAGHLSIGRIEIDITARMAVLSVRFVTQLCFIAQEFGDVVLVFADEVIWFDPSGFFKLDCV
jgi:hypothetical protein